MTRTEAIHRYRKALCAANGHDIDTRRIEQLVAAYALGWAEAELAALRGGAVHRDAVVVDGPVYRMGADGITPPLRPYQQAVLDEYRKHFTAPSGRMSGKREADQACLVHEAVTQGHPTSNPVRPCSWCEAETGIRTHGSHGICERHLKEMMAQVEKLGAPADTEGA